MKWLLLLSGGGAKGAFQVPIIERLVARLGLPTAVYGSSIGAGHAAMVGAGHTDKLRDLWLSIRGRDDFMRITINVLDGIHSLNPYRRILRSNGAADHPQCEVKVGITDLQAGRHILVDLGPLTAEERIDAILTSGSIPLIHDRRRWAGRWMADGGVLHVLPPCPNWRAFEEIHAITCFPPRAPIHLVDDNQVSSAIEQVGRATDLWMAQIMRRDIARLRRWRADADVMLYAPPSWDAIGPTFDGTPARIRQRLELGEATQGQVP